MTEEMDVPDTPPSSGAAPRPSSGAVASPLTGHAGEDNTGVRNSRSHLNTQPRGALNPGTLGLGGTESSVSSPLHRLGRAKGLPQATHSTTHSRVHRKS